MKIFMKEYFSFLETCYTKTCFRKEINFLLKYVIFLTFNVLMDNYPKIYREFFQDGYLDKIFIPFVNDEEIFPNNFAFVNNNYFENKNLEFFGENFLLMLNFLRLGDSSIKQKLHLANWLKYLDKFGNALENVKIEEKSMELFNYVKYLTKLSMANFDDFQTFLIDKKFINYFQENLNCHLNTIYGENLISILHSKLTLLQYLIAFTRNSKNVDDLLIFLFSISNCLVKDWPEEIKLHVALFTYCLSVFQESRLEILKNEKLLKFLNYQNYLDYSVYCRETPMSLLRLNISWKLELEKEKPLENYEESIFSCNIKDEESVFKIIQIYKKLSKKTNIILLKSECEYQTN